jgi:hypothetical protein
VDASFPVGNRAFPPGNACRSAGNRTFPVFSIYTSIKQFSFPSGNASFPRGNAFSPVEKAPFPAGNGSFPRGNSSFPPGNESWKPTALAFPVFAASGKVSSRIQRAFPAACEGLTCHRMCEIVCDLGSTKQLKGARTGEWAVDVDQNWRITFSFDGRDCSGVNYEDYH